MPKILIELSDEDYRDIDILNDDYIVSLIQNGTILNECEDCVSRTEVIDYLCKHCPDDGECFNDCDEIKHLRNLPSVYPKSDKPSGKWISSNGVKYTYFNSFTICSECKKHPKELSNVCPNCGAKMVESQKSEVADDK